MHGRVLNLKNEAYMLPVDPQEQARLNLEHLMLTTLIKGLYCAPEIVEPLLSPRAPDRPAPAVIDVGAGNGAWSVY
jgi:hypothetical protein